MSSADPVPAIRPLTALRSAILLDMLPPVLLVGIVAASGTAEIVLDHDLLGRNAAGMPMLQTLPVLREAINLWNLALIYLLPAALAAGLVAFGAKRAAPLPFLVTGGLLVCALGSLHRIKTAWTGIKGTSQLLLGVETDWKWIAARLALNLLALAAALWLVRRVRP